MAEGEGRVMQPGEDIKPQMTKDDAEVLLKKIYGLAGGVINELDGYDDLNYHFPCSNENENPNIENIWPHGYVLKVMNSLDSQNLALTEAQIEIMLFLKEKNITASIPVKDLQNRYYSVQKLPIGGKNQKNHIVRLLEFLPGKILKSISANYDLYFQAGKFLAKLDNTLKGFHHPVLENHRTIWHLSSGPQLRSFLYVLENTERKRMVEEILENFSAKILSVADNFEGGTIHGDFNEQNILVNQDKNGEWAVSGVLDFGDLCKSSYFFELSIAMCYMMLDCRRNGLDPIAGAGHLLSGYKIVRPSADFDNSSLKITISTRLCQSLVLGLYTHKLHPDNEYVFYNQKIGWPLLTEFWSMPIEIISQMWETVNKFYKN